MNMKKNIIILFNVLFSILTIKLMKTKKDPRKAILSVPTDHFELFEMTVQANFLAVIKILLGWNLLFGI
jgi:hypothetical protein